MLSIEKITNKNIEKLEELYNDFAKKSYKDYNFDLEPIEFEGFKQSVQDGFIQGFCCFEDENPIGFLLYSNAINYAVELNMMHFIKTEDVNKKKAFLLNNFVEYMKKNSDKQVISYPMVGRQYEFVEDIAYHNFNLIGQAIVEFSFNYPPSLVILEKAKINEIEPPYKITGWKDEYKEAAARITYERFNSLNDAEFDPRFKTIEGSTEIIEKIINNEYGDLLHEETTVLLQDDKPIGFCFVVLVVNQIANIPLIVVGDGQHRKHFGQTLLKTSLNKLIEFKKNIEPKLAVVNATCDTDNYPAMRAYRRVGFKEKTNYPHAYYKLK